MASPLCRKNIYLKLDPWYSTLVIDCSLFPAIHGCVPDKSLTHKRILCYLNTLMVAGSIFQQRTSLRMIYLVNKLSNNSSWGRTELLHTGNVHVRDVLSTDVPPTQVFQAEKLLALTLHYLERTLFIHLVLWECCEAERNVETSVRKKTTVLWTNKRRILENANCNFLTSVPLARQNQVGIDLLGEVL